MELDYNLIGKRIQTIRVQKKITQEKLAEQANLSTSYISAIETGTRHPTLDTLCNIGEILGTTVDNFIYGDSYFESDPMKEKILKEFDDCSSEEKDLLYDLLAASKDVIKKHKGARFGW